MEMYERFTDRARKVMQLANQEAQRFNHEYIGTEPSLTRPSRMCSVPVYSWLKRCASWLASCITLRARSVKRSYISSRLRHPELSRGSGAGHAESSGKPCGMRLDSERKGSASQPPAIPKGVSPVEIQPLRIRPLPLRPRP